MARSVPATRVVGLAISAGIVGLFGLGDMLGGISADPAIARCIAGQDIEPIRESAPAVARLADLGVRVGGATTHSDRRRLLVGGLLDQERVADVGFWVSIGGWIGLGAMPWGSR